MNEKRGSKKKKRLAVKIAAAVMALTMVVLAVVFVLLLRKPSKTSPEELLTAYVEKLKAADYEGMYEMISKESQQSITKEEFVERNQKIYEGIEASNFELVEKEAEEGKKDTVTILYTLSMDTLAGSVKVSWKASFTEEEERYGLIWTHAMIFPDLGPEDKVSIKKEEAQRGSIYDRNGQLLAGLQLASSVGLVPGKMQEDASDDLERLAELLNTTVESIEKKLDASWVKEDSFVPIKTIEKVDQMALNQGNASEEMVNLQKLHDQLLEIDGIMITDTQLRGYPLKQAASHLIGYVQPITAEELEEHAGEGYTSTSVIGKSGLEKLYEEELRGSTGWRISILDDSGQEKEVIAAKPCENGKDIILTIDANLQSLLYEQFGQDKSTAAAINPKTGEVLALLSTPGYNNNLFVRGMSQAEWDAISNDENTPMQNRFKAVWCPGSSMKPLIAAIGLTTGTLTAEEDLGQSGLSWQKDESWGDYSVTTLHQAPDARMENALIYSDNIYFAKAALKIGGDTLSEQLDNLGFGEELSFDFGLTPSQYSNGEGFESEIQLADSGYGQGQVLVNPLHMASVYSAFYNRGNMIDPYLKQKDSLQASYWKENVFSAEACETVEEMMIQIIENPNGTGHNAKLDGITLAGKTGTAELKVSKEDTEGTELGWFNVYTVTQENPILMVTMVEDVKGRGGSGYVVDKVHQVLSEYVR